MLKPTNSLGRDDIPGILTKYCSAIFIPIPKYMLNVSLTQQFFLVHGRKLLFYESLKQWQSCFCQQL
jgi:hypothetical protein